jgi:hypothetical protein
MHKKNFRQFFARSLAFWIVSAALLLPIESYATLGVYDDERNSSYNSGSHKCELGSIDFNWVSFNIIHIQLLDLGLCINICSAI